MTISRLKKYLSQGQKKRNLNQSEKDSKELSLVATFVSDINMFKLVQTCYGKYAFHYTMRKVTLNSYKAQKTLETQKYKIQKFKRST